MGRVVTIVLVTEAAVLVIGQASQPSAEPGSTEPWPTYRARFEEVVVDLPASGASACASSTCHGGATPSADEVFLGREYDLWHDGGKGRHFRAYKLLYENERSDRMAKMLYGPDAVAKERGECLGCHAFVVPAELVPRRLDIEDGVSCEACHGRGGEWIGKHTIPGWRDRTTEPQRTESGYYDTRHLIRRAEKCLECHLGTEDKEVTHAMLAAGHPPMRFELSHDLEAVPRHWRDRQSYLAESEGDFFHARVWAVGQAVALRESMYRLIQWSSRSGATDFAVFECYACHHEIERSTWRHARRTPGEPGQPVADLSAWAMCKPIATVMMPDAVSAFEERINRLVRQTVIGVSNDGNAIGKTAGELASLADRLAVKVESTMLDRDKTVALLRALAADGPDIGGTGFEAARQAFLAFHTLYARVLRAAGRGENDAEIMRLLAALHDLLYDRSERPAPAAYDADRFAEIVKKLRGQFDGV